MTGILGAVLIGGRSSRFGSDKAQAMFGDRSLAEHAAAALRPFAQDVVMIGGEAVPDLPGPGLGPLGGIAAALDHGASRGFRCVLTIGCDMPRVPDDVFETLLHRAPAFCSDAPVLGLWPSALGAHLLSYLEVGGDRSVRGWARAVGAIPIASGSEIPNVNTRDDLMAL